MDQEPKENEGVVSKRNKRKSPGRSIDGKEHNPEGDGPEKKIKLSKHVMSLHFMQGKRRRDAEDDLEVANNMNSCRKKREIISSSEDNGNLETNKTTKSDEINEIINNEEMSETEEETEDEKDEEKEDEEKEKSEKKGEEDEEKGEGVEGEEEEQDLYKLGILEYRWFLNEYKDALDKVEGKKESRQILKTHFTDLNYLGRKIYSKKSKYLETYNRDIEQFISSIKKNKPINSLRE